MLPCSQSESDYIIITRKSIHRVVEDSTSGNSRASASPHSPPELRITYEIRTNDNPGQTIKLQFHARRVPHFSRLSREVGPSRKTPPERRPVENSCQAPFSPQFPLSLSLQPKYKGNNILD